jgi:hypothetical protein
MAVLKSLKRIKGRIGSPSATLLRGHLAIAMAFASLDVVKQFTESKT